MITHQPTETDPYPPSNTERHTHAHTRLIQAAPSPKVIAAAQFLLHQPDAYLYRRRYLELITHTTAPDGTTITDYTAAEKYLLNTAATQRKATRRYSVFGHATKRNALPTLSGRAMTDPNPRTRTETSSVADSDRPTAPPGGDTESLLTPKQVAELFQVTTKTVARWADEGKIGCTTTIGGHRRYHRTEILTLLNKLHNPGPQASL